MATLSKMIILWWLLIALQVSFNFIAPNIITKQKVFLGRSTKRMEQLMKHLSTKKQKRKATRNVAITEKNRLCQITVIYVYQKLKGRFQINLPLILMV